MAITLDKKDVMAVANSRYRRQIQRKILVTVCTCLGAMIIGMAIARWSTIMGYILFGVAGLYFLYFIYAVDKYQKKFRDKMVGEWEKEQAKS